MAQFIDPETIWPDLASETQDGRRQRSTVARQKIVTALFEILREGNMAPEAAIVAERANVGLRTVFRHFEDMDSIYHEMTDRLMRGILPRVLAPLEAEGWTERLVEYAGRRAEIYEAVFPMRMCLGVRRYQSDFLMDRFKRDLELERSSLQAFLPRAILNDKTLFLAIEAALAFPNWRRLRKDVGLSVEDAEAVILRSLAALVKDLPNDE